MFESARHERPPPGGVALPQALFGHEMADGRQSACQGLLGQHPLGVGRRHGQDQLEILAIAQGVIKGPGTVRPAQLDGRFGQRNAVQFDDRAAATLLGQVPQIER